MNPSQDDTRVPIPHDEAYELLKLKIVREVENEVLNRAALRFKWIGIVVGFVGLVGVNGIGYLVIEGVLGPKIDQVSVAVALSNNAIKRANEATDLAILKAQKAGDLSENINSRLKTISLQVENTSKRSQAQADISRTGLQEQFDALEAEFREKSNTNNTTSTVAIKREEANTALDQFKTNSETSIIYAQFPASSAEEEIRIIKITNALIAKGFNVIPQIWRRPSDRYSTEQFMRDFERSFSLPEYLLKGIPTDGLVYSASGEKELDEILGTLSPSSSYSSEITRIDGRIDNATKQRGEAAFLIYDFNSN